MRLPKIVTARLLRALGACPGEACLFQKTFPKGAEVNVLNVTKAARKGINLFWFARQIAERFMVYDAIGKYKYKLDALDKKLARRIREFRCNKQREEDLLRVRGTGVTSVWLQNVITAVHAASAPEKAAIFMEFWDAAVARAKARRKGRKE